MGYGAVAEANVATMMTNSEPHMDEQPMTTAEAARHLGINPGYLTNLRCWGTGPRWRRIGVRGVRYDRVELEEWREGRESRPRQEARPG